MIAAGALGLTGAAAGVGQFYLLATETEAGQELFQALLLLTVVAEPLALIAAALGLRAVWRQLEGWASR